MSSYDPFRSFEGVYGLKASSLTTNPFQTVHKRARPDRELANHRAEGQPASKSVRVAVERPLTIFDRPAPHSDVVYRLVDTLLKLDGKNLEIEAKIGTVFDKSSGTRACEVLPVSTDCAINPEFHAQCRFESAVSKQTFQKVNHVLNSWVSDSQRGDKRVEYVKRSEIDVQYDDGTRESRSVGANGKRQIERVIRKRRLNDVNMVCPMTPYDLRYSISAEDPATTSASSRPRSEREKNRMSYKFGHLSVDITMATTHEPVELQGEKIVRLGVPQESYEIEVEMEFPPDFNLMVECENLRRQSRAQTSRLHNYIEELVSSAKALAALV